MSSPFYLQLDNPAWAALTGPQRSFALGFDHVKRYRPANLSFAAFDHAYPGSLPDLDQWLQPGEVFFLIGELPALPANWSILSEIPCLQMINPDRIKPMDKSVEMIPLTEVHKQEMQELVQKVLPGYFAPDTYQLGNYYGIWEDGQLAAMAGERMRVTGMCELSAICTHPQYTGRKYAQHLITALCNNNLDKGIIPFLHVSDTNERAVKLYEFMGFSTRRLISFWKLQKSS